MKAKILAALFLAAVLVLNVTPGASAADAPAVSGKVIKDVAEYNAYIAALNTPDPTQRAAAMEAFVVKYPASVVKIDALEQAVAAYKQAGNAAKVESTARRLLALQPDNIRALAIVTFLERASAGTDAAALVSMRGHAEQGLRALASWTKPDGTSDGDFAKLQGQIGAIFNGAMGFALLNSKDYAKARDAYLKAIASDGTNFTDLYQLGLAGAAMTPLDANAFWYLARAAAVAAAQSNTAARDAIGTYAKAQYRRYHGGNDGWDAILTAAAAQTAPPRGFAAGIKPAPAPAEIAVNAVRDNDPATLSFSDWEFILSYRDASPANKAAADKVWAAIRSKEQNGTVKLRIPVVVIATTHDSIDAAITNENIAARNADIHIVMAAPMLHPPASGATINITGVITSYTSSPFMFTMTQGQL